MLKTKNGFLACTLALCLALLGSSCGLKGGDESFRTDSSAASVPAFQTATALCRIVDGAEDGNLLLADQANSNVYRYSVGEEKKLSGLWDGMLVRVTYNGGILETFPSQFAEVTGIAIAEEKPDDLCGLYLRILQELWDDDPLLRDGITIVGVDLSDSTLRESEKAAIAWRFGELHGKTAVRGTYAKLAKQGYIDKATLSWKDGCLFSVTPKKSEGSEGFSFDAGIWRSSTGAVYWTDCMAKPSDNGVWQYERGAIAIS